MTQRAGAILLCTILAGCMEQAKQHPLSRTPSLYTRLGGEARLKKVAEAWVDEVLKADAVKEPIKKEFRDDREAREQALVHHLGAATGGPQEPSRKGLSALFDGVPVESVADLDALRAALGKALEAQDVGPRTRGEVLALFDPLREKLKS
jgi:hypothetical protein